MKWAATFGQKYNHDDVVHPINPDITGYSFVVFDAPDSYEAHVIMHEKYEVYWAFVYPYDDSFGRQIREYGLHEVPFDIEVGKADEQK